MLIGALIRGECEIPGRSIYKLEQSILKIFKFSIAGDCGLSSRAGQRTRFCFFREKMVQSAAIKQGRLASCKHIFFFLALADPTINRPKSKFLIYSTQAAVLRYRPTIFNNDRGCVRQLFCSAHDRISEKVNLKVCCFESSKQKRRLFKKVQAFCEEKVLRCLLGVFSYAESKNQCWQAEKWRLYYLICIFPKWPPN